MPRLFIAIHLPPTVTAPLAKLLPVPIAGMRRIQPEQMHLTLHFIGEADIAQIAALIQPVRMQPFQLNVTGVGTFSHGAVLWAGVKPDPALLVLHAELGRALAVGNIPTETRPYCPHITLARCKPHASRAIRHFLAHNAGLQLPAVQVFEFSLYSSTPSADGPIYRIERSFPA